MGIEARDFERAMEILRESMLLGEFGRSLAIANVEDYETELSGDHGEVERRFADFILEMDGSEPEDVPESEVRAARIANVAYRQAMDEIDYLAGSFSEDLGLAIDESSKDVTRMLASIREAQPLAPEEHVFTANLNMRLEGDAYYDHRSILDAIRAIQEELEGRGGALEVRTRDDLARSFSYSLSANMPGTTLADGLQTILDLLPNPELWSGSATSTERGLEGGRDYELAAFIEKGGAISYQETVTKCREVGSVEAASLDLPASALLADTRLAAEMSDAIFGDAPASAPEREER